MAVIGLLPCGATDLTGLGVQLQRTIHQDTAATKRALTKIITSPLRRLPVGRSVRPVWSKHDLGQQRETGGGGAEFTAEGLEPVLREACAVAALDCDGAELLRLGSNAVFGLTSLPVIVSIARDPSTLAETERFLSSQSREAFTHYLQRETPAPPKYRYLDNGSAVVVPGAIPLFDGRYQWLRPPTRRPAANPLRPVARATALVASAELLARIDRFDERYPTPYGAVAALPEESDIEPKLVGCLGC
ncbi:hypothetical protein ACGFX8_37805 [Streptomyces sp. NPDC048362]|uniref:hypothetical protein n=1 Tax=Streptomyces sp. NPDC048362 TaxID=3365539 RepID=UPI00371BFE5C